jgi:hypothetical protein
VTALDGLACRRYRGALIAFVDRREEGASTPAALVHLDRCRRCRGELESIALAIIALHRFAGELDRAVPPLAPAPRVTAPRRVRLPRLALAGPLFATALAAVLLLPALGLHGQVVPKTDARPPAVPVTHIRQLSADYLPARGTGSAQFWSYGTFGLTAKVLWPPSGPSRLPLDPERSRFDLRAASRLPGVWSTQDEPAESPPASPDVVAESGATIAESI